MNLVIDIGNTRSKMAVFEGTTLLERWTWEKWSVEDLLGVLTNHRIQNLLLCSVGSDRATELRPHLPVDLNFWELNAQTPLPFVNAYETPETLGKDRLAAVAGAWALSPGQNCLVVDAGTCVTYEVVRADGTYLGGNIAPGLKMRLRAMHEFTARLPLVEAEPLGNWIGASTRTAMLNGATLGLVHEVKGHWEAMQNNFGPTKVFLSGGDASAIARESVENWTVEPNLVLIGLNHILNHCLSA
jgi:type III pantothenate kinase